MNRPVLQCFLVLSAELCLAGLRFVFRRKVKSTAPSTRQQRRENAKDRARAVKKRRHAESMLRKRVRREWAMLWQHVWENSGRLFAVGLIHATAWFVKLAVLACFLVVFRFLVQAFVYALAGQLCWIVLRCVCSIWPPRRVIAAFGSSIAFVTLCRAPAATIAAGLAVLER